MHFSYYNALLVRLSICTLSLIIISVSLFSSSMISYLGQWSKLIKKTYTILIYIPPTSAPHWKQLASTGCYWMPPVDCGVLNYYFCLSLFKLNDLVFGQMVKTDKKKAYTILIYIPPTSAPHWKQLASTGCYWMPPVDCGVLNWHLLGTSLLNTWQSLAKQHKASDKQWSKLCTCLVMLV